MTRKLKVLLFFITGISLWIGYINLCKNEDILNIDDETRQLFDVGCKNGVKYLKPPEGYKWLDESGKEVRIYSDARRWYDFPKNFLAKSFNGREFVSYHKKKLVSYGLDNLNKYLSERMDFNSEYEDIYLVRLWNSGNISYELFFYIKDNIPEYIYLCIGYCHSVEPIFLEVVKEN